jgi:hypothetical protein
MVEVLTTGLGLGGLEVCFSLSNIGNGVTDTGHLAFVGYDGSEDTLTERLNIHIGFICRRKLATNNQHFDIYPPKKDVDLRALYKIGIQYELVVATVGLTRLDNDDRLSLLDLVARRFEPAHDLSLSHGGGQSRHEHFLDSIHGLKRAPAARHGHAGLAVECLTKARCLIGHIDGIRLSHYSADTEIMLIYTQCTISKAEKPLSKDRKCDQAGIDSSLA